MIKQVPTDTDSFDVLTEELHHELTLATELIQQYVDQNSRIGLDQLEYQ